MKFQQYHRVLGIWCFVGLASWLFAVGPADAQSESTVSRKLLRQIGVMEKILDQVLLDSPNFLVYGRENARGIYIDEFGVLLTFEASLVSRGDNYRSFPFDIEEDEDGDRVIIFPDWDEDDSDSRRRDRDDDKDKDRDKDKDEDRSDEDDSDSRKSRRSRNPRDREARTFAHGKIEIEDLLLDYGDTITKLKDSQWVGVAAFLKGSDYFIDQRISRWILKAKMSDLRAWNDGDIDEDEMRSRFVQEEY